MIIEKALGGGLILNFRIDSHLIVCVCKHISEAYIYVYIYMNIYAILKQKCITEAYTCIFTYVCI